MVQSTGTARLTLCPAVPTACSLPSLIWKSSRGALPVPVQTQGVQEGREPLHDQQDGHRQHRERREDDEDGDEACPAAAAEPIVHHHGPKHL